MAYAFKYIFYFERRNGYEVSKIHTAITIPTTFLTSFLTNFITPNLALADSPKQSQKLLGTFLRGAFTDVIIKLLTLMHQNLLTLTMLSRIFVGMENMETLLLILIIQINKRGTVKNLVYHCKIKRFLMVLSYSGNHGLMLPNRILPQGQLGKIAINMPVAEISGN